MRNERRRLILDEKRPEIEYVNFGLPSGRLWATGNLMKDSRGHYYTGSETDCGVYVSWGNIVGYYESEGYDFSQENYDLTAGANVSTNISSNDRQHDICFAKLRSSWHLPTKEDCAELYNYTRRQYVSNYNGTGVNGMKFIKKNDTSVYIFIPFFHVMDGTTVTQKGVFGFFWSSTWSSNENAYAMGIDRYQVASITQNKNYSRRFGMPIRPVK